MRPECLQALPFFSPLSCTWGWGEGTGWVLRLLSEKLHSQLSAVPNGLRGEACILEVGKEQDFEGLAPTKDLEMANLY